MGKSEQFSPLYWYYTMRKFEVTGSPWIYEAMCSCSFPVPLYQGDVLLRSSDEVWYTESGVKIGKIGGVRVELLGLREVVE